jgi:hypothetical protein
VEVVGISPLGAYAGGEYRPLAKGAEGSALQVLPSLTWRPRDGLAFTVAWPQEINRSNGVVLPSLHPQDGRFSETAPGRLSAHGRLRLPDAGWAARPWVGLGYALSDPIGTDDIRDSIDEIPEQGLEALGAGTDDAFATFELVAAERGPWQFGTGLEGRIHTLPRFRRIYGTTVAWHGYGSRALGAGWSADLRLSGFRTIVTAVSESQANALIVRPSITRELRRGTRLSAGVSSEVPGVSANENSLRTIGVHISVANHF